MRWEASKAKYCTAIAGQRSAVEGCCELEAVFVSDVTRLRICPLLLVWCEESSFGRPGIIMISIRKKIQN